MKRLLALLFVVMAAIPAGAQVADFGVASSPNIVGSGARALGVGGAFIAIADDGTAASWNPAALIILERPEAAVMGSYASRDIFDSANFTDFNYIAVSYPFAAFKRNMIVSFNYQRLFDFNSKFSRVTTNLAVPQSTSTAPVFEFTDPGGFDVFSLNSSSTIVDFLEISDDSTGDIGAIAPAFAVQIIPQLSIGVTVNFWMDGIVNDGFSRKYRERQNATSRLDTILWVDTDFNGVRDTTEWAWTDADSNGACNAPPDITPGNGDCVPDPGEGETLTFPGNARSISSKTSVDWKNDFFGINANIGLLWRANQHITVGAVYKMPFTARADVDITVKSEETIVDTVTGDVSSSTAQSKTSAVFDFMFPAVYGLGVAYRFNDNFTAALDVSFTDWANFKVKERRASGLKTDPGPFGTGGEDLLSDGPTRSAVNMLNVDGYCDRRTVNEPCSGPDDPRFHDSVDIDGAITARLGLEYLFILEKTIIPARLGFAYDPQPALGSPDDFFSVSTGTGVVLFKRFILDAAYQYRWGNNVTRATQTNGDGSELLALYRGDVIEHIALFSTIVHF